MKFAVVVLACVLAAANAQFNPYNRASAFASFGAPQPQNPYNRNYQPYRPVTTTLRPFVPLPQPIPVAPIAPLPSVVPRYTGYDARNAQILKFGNEINPDGSYNYFYETENGIAAQEQGIPRNFGGNPPVIPDVAQGSFSWTSPEGKVISISYIADENGYQPQGDAIPQPPPIPPQIARALEYTARYNKQ